MKPKQNPLPAVFLLLFLLLGASLIMFLAQQPPALLPASISASEFSAERAFRHVVTLTDEPRPVDTNAHLQTRNFIMSELEALGLSPQIQETTLVDPESPAFPGMTVAGTVQNVITRLAGKQETRLSCLSVITIRLPPLQEPVTMVLGWRLF